jgi:hypothetical protein
MIVFACLVNVCLVSAVASAMAYLVCVSTQHRLQCHDMHIQLVEITWASSVTCCFLINSFRILKKMCVKVWWFLPDTQEYEKLVTSYTEPVPAAPWTNKCLTPQEFLEMFGLEPQHTLIISPNDFLNLCPAIVYELDQRSCYNDTDQQTSTNLTTQHSGLFVFLHFCLLMTMS